MTRLASTNGAFAALRSDGTLVAWGDVGCGGSAPELRLGRLARRSE